MDITKTLPLRFDIVPIPESTLICEFKLKGIKEQIKINIDLIVYYRKHSRQHINVLDSGMQNIYTSKEDKIHTIKLKVPKFKEKERTQSFILISIDKWQKVCIEDITVEEDFKHEARLNKEKEILRAKAERLKIKIADIKNNGVMPDIICEGLMLGHSGLAKAMRNIAFGLYNSGCHVRTHILDWDSIGSIGTEKGSKINQLRIENSDIKEDPSFWITMNNAMAVRRHEYSYSIGYVMFETVDFPSKYVQHLETQNEIWTPSIFCKDSMIRAGVKNIHVMHLGIDPNIFNPEKVEPMKFSDDIVGKDKEKYKFLTVMGYSERKGASLLIRSFVEEFGGDNNVVLYVKGGWYDPNIAQEEVKNLTKDISNPPLIHLDFNLYSDNSIARIYKACDCFILPTKGEGFGLPFAEAMCMEMPVIGTRYGGQLDFMNDDNSYLINIDGFAPDPRCNWICGEYVGGRFAVPNKDHLKQLMRYIYENREEAKFKGKMARKHIIENFTWEKSCECMVNRLKDIAREHVN